MSVVAMLTSMLGANVSPGRIPAYPIAYDAGENLNAAAKAAHDAGYGAQWAGQGARRSIRSCRQGTLARELSQYV